ncbi:MAG TPA: thioredoxin family protein [Pyrinomonadaceae bacterium]|jgi:peroxiredoxin|nr:thioredoxin family protein [Pyrinomonadaceae bacterium]
MMRKLYAYALMLAVGCLLAAGLVMARDAGMQEQGSAGIAIGQKISDFTLTDVDGKKHSLASLKGEKGTVLIFVAVQCPVSNAYNERMEKLAQDYKARGINVVGINSNSTESTDDVRHHAAEHHLTFTILKDRDNKIADMLGAEHTPEAYLFDTSNKLLYHGRIDNSRNTAGVSSNDLRDAIDATLAGQPVKNAYVRAFGCSIKRAS